MRIIPFKNGRLQYMFNAKAGGHTYPISILKPFGSQPGGSCTAWRDPDKAGKSFRGMKSYHSIAEAERNYPNLAGVTSATQERINAI